jgi:hypothetical protein
LAVSSNVEEDHVHLPRTICLCLAALLVAACSDDTTTSPDAPRPGDADAAVGAEGGVGPEAGGDQGQPAALPPVPQQSGVVYVVHYHTTDLRAYRIDGSDPKQELKLELGANKGSHDMALDPQGDRLFIVSDAAKSVDIYQLQRPASATAALTPPAKLASIILASGEIPLFARVDGQRGRLYVVASPGGSAIPTEYLLLAYDVTDPATPKPLAGSPFKIPVTTSLALDGPRQALFVVETKTQKLHGFDLRGDKLEPLAGEPLDLLALYPQQNQTAFQARSLTADPWRNRLYAARSQTALSELIIIEYPSALPTAQAGYGQLAKMGDLKVVADPFDVDVPADQRPNLLDAFEPAVDLERGDVLLSAGAWTGSGTGAILVGVTGALKLAKGCDAFEGFGCWYRSYLSGQPGSIQRTDGALCVDYTHKVVVGTSVDAVDETLPGAIHLLRYQDNLDMTDWVPSGGANLPAGGLPIAAVCH